jgi:hypothetical protein
MKSRPKAPVQPTAPRTMLIYQDSSLSPDVADSLISHRSKDNRVRDDGKSMARKTNNLARNHKTAVRLFFKEAVRSIGYRASLIGGLGSLIAFVSAPSGLLLSLQMVRNKAERLGNLFVSAADLTHCLDRLNHDPLALASSIEKADCQPFLFLLGLKPRRKVYDLGHLPLPPEVLETCLAQCRSRSRTPRAIRAAQKKPATFATGQVTGSIRHEVIRSVESLPHFDPAGCGCSHTASRKGGGRARGCCVHRIVIWSATKNDHRLPTMMASTHKGRF